MLVMIMTTIFDAVISWNFFYSRTFKPRTIMDRACLGETGVSVSSCIIMSINSVNCTISPKI